MDPSALAAKTTVKVVVTASPEEVPTEPVDGLPTLVYWNSCGIAQPIRMALALAGVDFCDVRIEPGDDETAENYKKSWFDAKERVGEKVAFPNLPYFLHGDVSLSQSNAILRHIGRKYGLHGPPEKEHIFDMVLEQLADLDRASARLAYPEGLDALKTWVQEDLPKSVPYFERLLGEHHYLTGELPCVADVKLYEFLRKVKIIEKESGISKDENKVIGSAKLGMFMKVVTVAPRLKSYMESEDYLERPLNNPHAKFK